MSEYIITSELKPCPFCGGENVETSYKDTFSGDFRRGVYCADCCGGVYPYYDTEAEAVEAWNTRAERTCHDRNASAREHGAYLFMWRCSNCGESYDTEMGKLNYCPNCGAKVVSE